MNSLTAGVRRFVSTLPNEKFKTEKSYPRVAQPGSMSSEFYRSVCAAILWEVAEVGLRVVGWRGLGHGAVPGELGGSWHL